ncbi:hypothetical protein CAL7716_000650 [Calothrix sp. PCC 7716]|nr:hypothetical protein CAL7716_000650 [Calothrix sp. PCC 7716]
MGSGSTRFILDAGVESVTIYAYSGDDSISRGSTLAANSLLSVSISGNDTLVSAGSDLLATLKSTPLNSVNII